MPAGAAAADVPVPAAPDAPRTYPMSLATPGEPAAIHRQPRGRVDTSAPGWKAGDAAQLV